MVQVQGEDRRWESGRGETWRWVACEVAVGFAEGGDDDL